MKGLEHLGIDELRAVMEAAELAGDTERARDYQAELDTRDIESYEQGQAEAKFGA